MKTKKIKVLHIISSLGIGGAERQLLELIEANTSHGVCQLIPNENSNDYLLTNKSRFYNLGMRKTFPDPRIFFKLKKTINIYKPQIIHTWMYHASLLEVLVRKLGKKKNIPLIWGIRCSNMDTKYYSLQLRMVIKACKFFSSVPNVIISNSLSGEVFHKNLGFNNNNFKTVLNGINTEKFKPNPLYRRNFRKLWKIKDSTKVFLCIARVDPMKDHTTLLKAFCEARKINKDIILFLVGNKTHTFSDMEGVIPLGISKKVEEIYPGADFIISSSAFGEGFSNVIAEGMSAGLIPIATNVGDAKMIMDGNGILVKPQDVTGLKIAINKLAIMDKNILENKKRETRKRIISKYSRSQMLFSYNQIYKELVDNL